MLQQPVTLPFRQGSAGPRWGNHHQGHLGVGNVFEGPSAESFKPSNKTEKLLVQALQLLESQVRQAAQTPYGLWHDWGFTFQQLGR